MADKAKDPIDELFSADAPQDEKVKILLRENARLRKKIEKRESGWELIESVLEEVYDAPSGLHVRTPPKSKKKSKPEVACLHLTDIHFGKRTESYSASVVEERLLVLQEAVAEITSLRRSFAKCDTLKLLFGGDFLEGQDIFPGQAYEVDVDIVNQVLKDGPEMYTNTLAFLAGLFRNIEVYGVGGNHGRQNRFGDKRYNADSILYNTVRSMFQKLDPKAAKRVTWDLPFDRPPGREWFSRFDLTDTPGKWGGMLIHGDQVRGGAFGFPWYSYARRVGGWSTADATKGFDYLFGGHFHTAANFDLNKVTVLATGSTESGNAYALENYSGAGRPQQRLCFFGEKHGLLADHRVYVG